MSNFEFDKFTRAFQAVLDFMNSLTLEEWKAVEPKITLLINRLRQIADE